MARLTAAEPGSGDAELSRLALLFALTTAALFALMSLAEWAAWGGLSTAINDRPDGVEALGETLLVTGVSLAFGLLVIALVAPLRPMSKSWGWRILILTCASAAAAFPRAAVLQAVRTTPSGALYGATEWIVGTASGLVGGTAAFLAAVLLNRARVEADRRREEEHRSAQAVAELQDEELRVRRMVADQLHGTLQFRLVTVTAGLDQVAEELNAAGHASASRTVTMWAKRLDEIREEDVRSLSHAVFPAGADLGTTEAIGILLKRLPPGIDTSVTLGPTYQRLVRDRMSPMPIAERLVAIYAVEEAVTNALKHGRARSVQVRADAQAGERPDTWVFKVTVDDDGVGLRTASPAFHGLERHRARIEQRGGVLSLTARPTGGARLELTMPFQLADGSPTQANVDKPWGPDLPSAV
ncbi:sensor histidine kinase [Gryllotalpicola reticulitermitis]|uniref:Sensor histidine kinase n=1 Tax=Gryllotalpicola reticulitermitis TaxID=1184153 RepID=A0ABV8QDF1_9MICO